MSFEESEELENAGTGGTDIAVIGLSARFPGGETVEELWGLLASGREAIRALTEAELRASGVPKSALDDPSYVKRMGVLRDVEMFDAAFFGYSPREAEVLEPAHRIFLECAWEALENAGCDPARFPGAVGVFAGCGESNYTEANVLPRRDVVAALGGFQLSVGSNKDFFATRVAYKLDLRGPAMAVQTGCSSSLVAIHVAAQALLARECDVALAGGASILVPLHSGYAWEPGGIMSADGTCRPFDADSTGSAAGSGAGAVVLKRLEDALRDGDTVRAVIRGSAVNNDGGLKVAFTAPSVEGQAAVIGEALAVAGVHPESIRFVEGHGSGTELGDPVEIAALTEAFRLHTGRTGFCAVGSIKSSVGHTDAAAGVAGFIKTVLALEHAIVPPTANFRAPNPRIPFASSPFYVSAAAEPWERGSEPRRAGVSSFGIGGTNAHVILEEAPAPVPSRSRRAWHLLTLSAKTASALDAATARLAAHLRDHPGLPLADAAHTLQTGRREMAHRRVLAIREGEDAAALLEGRQPERLVSASVDDQLRSVAFLFPGVGDQYPQMARGLYESEPVFRAEVDRCAEILRARFGLDLVAALYPGAASAEADPGAGVDLRAMLAREEADPAAEALNRTEVAQPAVFVVEYALARLWMSWGIVPAALIGHSLGEYAAAAIAGIFSLEDALELVTARGRMIGQLPAGAMLAVPLSADAVRPFLVDGADVAALNAPEMCTVAGMPEAVETVRLRLADAGHVARPLRATHAFHSPQMDPLVAPVREMAARMRLRAPAIPLVSDVTGTWLTPEEAADPAYWARHIREPVRFERGVAALLADPGRVLLELGPGQTLSTFVRQRADAAGVPVIPTVRYPYDRTPDAAFAMNALGRLWLAGVTPDWRAFHDGERLRRIPLPTYPWERRRYWIDTPAEGDAAPLAPRAGKRADPAEWLYTPVWKRTPAVRSSDAGDGARWLVFTDGGGMGDDAAAALRERGCEVVLVRPGERFEAATAGEMAIRPGAREDYDALVREAAAGDSPLHALHLGALGESGARGMAFVGVALLAAALGRRGVPARLVAVTAGAHDVTGAEVPDPFAATVAGACAVAPEEHPALRCAVIDVERDDRAAAALVAAEALGAREDAAVAIRRGRRWVRGFDRVSPSPISISRGETWFFAGGLDGRNETLARHLALRHGARLVLADERIPDRAAWDAVAAARLADDPVRRRIDIVRALESAGIEVLTLRSRLDNPRVAGDALAAAERRFGRVHGVVISPTLDGLDGFEALADAAPGDWTRRLGIAAQELESLRAALASRDVGVVMVESSLTPVLGGVGRGRMAAAQAFVDAFAAATPGWTSLAWDRWHDAAEVDGGYGMTEDEAARAFEHALSLAGEPRLLVSTGDVAARIAEAHRPATQTPAGHARPELGTDYVAPRTEAEEAVARMWEELLGIDRIGVHDDFFGMGGHSLLATQIVSRVRTQFGLELPLKSVFEAPTVARYAELIEAAIMAEIEEMSEEEILSLV
ncbi:polyketide synthase [Longimicrobium sp.]|uniref:type I polyketide synthase n=1 Tax=Longimicrobium sp. TaxID=2029185 RepID=UPI002BF346D6|nr:polyketide synthase [Longimicrobium sp.]HSU17606.1 beta-ketoacyl synthase N-terminal-like domain-containing protein [Longimicrobium sp.]